MRSLAPWALVALVCTLGCSRDHPLFDTGDAGADARPGNGNGAVTELVPVRRDAGVLPDLGPAVRDQCVAACEEYAGCGVVVDCSASDAAWVESVCARGCPSGEWAEAVASASDCRTVVETAHADRADLETACQLEQAVCEGYAEKVAECVVVRCPGAAGEAGRVRSEILRACEESIVLGETTPEAATRVAETACTDAALGRGIQRYINAELGSRCGDDPPPVGGLGEEQCTRACGKQTHPNCMPMDPPPEIADPAVCEQRCRTNGAESGLYNCLGGVRGCELVDLCRTDWQDDCVRVCADVAECAGGDAFCAAVDRRSQSAFFQSCNETCGGRSAFVAALDNGADCAAKLDFLTGASPDFAAACGD